MTRGLALCGGQLDPGDLLLATPYVTGLRHISEPHNFVTHTAKLSRQWINGVMQVMAGTTAPMRAEGCCSEAEIEVLIGIEFALPPVPPSRFGGRAI